MAEDFQSYLASTVLSDDKIVTFRVVSRALNVNSFHAKRMLFVFHQRENAKRASSVHATYIVTGLRKFPASSYQGDTADTTESGAEGDVQMQSSSFPGSSVAQDGQEVNQVTIKALTLVGEDRLEELKALYAEVHSVSMYSVQCGPLKNLDLITSVYEQLHQESQKLDPLESIKTYGSIQNPYVKRRTSHRPTPPSRIQEGTSMSKASAKAMFQKSSDTKKHSNGGADSRQPSKSKSDTDTNTRSQGSQPASSLGSRPPSIKRESSSIFKSFAKAKAPKSKVEASKASGPTDSSASGAHSMPIGDLSTRGDVKLQEDVDMEDDEGDGDSQFVENSASSAKPPKSKAERDAELHKKIFDDDGDDDDESSNKDRGSAVASQQDEANDEEMPDAPNDSNNQDDGIDDEDDEGTKETSNAGGFAEEVAKDTQSSEEDEKEDESGQPTGSGNGDTAAGRRRGRRRVVRKRMIKDADGYLVTKEEPGWESFSEDEAAGPTSGSVSKLTGQGQLKNVGKSSSATPPSSSATSGSKKGSSQASGAAKKGQGNIMSFFGKK